MPNVKRQSDCFLLLTGVFAQEQNKTKQKIISKQKKKKTVHRTRENTVVGNGKSGDSLRDRQAHWASVGLDGYGITSLNMPGSN